MQLDSVDAQVVNLLQLAPLARWSDIGDALGISASTAIRRWERLRADGSAWTTTYPGNSLLALVEINTLPMAADQVGDALVRMPQVVTVERMAGYCDLLCTVMTEDVAGLAETLQTQIALLPDLQSSRTQIVTHTYVQGADWTLRAVESAVADAWIRRADGSSFAGHGDTFTWSDLDKRLLLGLSSDARIPLTQLAPTLGASLSTVRRRLANLVDNGRITVRAEVARGLTAWPVSATLWLSVDAHTLHTAAQTIRRIPEVRFCASVTGQTNLILQIWLRSTEDLPRVEASLSRAIPGLRVVDRAIVLKQFKLMGRRVDEVGRAIGDSIPIAPWRTKRES